MRRSVHCRERRSFRTKTIVSVRSRHNNYLKELAGWRIQSAFLSKCAMSASDDNGCPRQIRKQPIGRLVSYRYSFVLVALLTVFMILVAHLFYILFLVSLEEDTRSYLYNL